MYFCVAPWNHIKLNANGTWKHCCVFESKFDKPFNGDIKDTSNHQSFKDIRKQMLWGDKPPAGCIDCVKNEATINSTSLRENLNKLYADRIHDYKRLTKKDGTYDDFKLEYLDIRSSNLCNYKCRFCGIQSSSSWLADTKLIHKSTPPNANKAGVMESNISWNQLKEHLPHVRYVKLAGGEPLMMPGTYQLLDELIKIKNTDIEILINTNASFVKYGNRDIAKLLSKFKSVHLCLSIDGMDQIHNYLRSGKDDWKKIEKNIQVYLKSNLSVDFLSSVSWFNCIHMISFLEKYSSNIAIKFNSVYWPKHMSIGLLEKSDIDNVLLKIKNSNLSTKYKNQYYDFIKSLYETTKITDSNEKKQLYTEFSHYTAILDKSRNQNFIKTFPEWELFYNKITKN